MPMSLRDWLFSSLFCTPFNVILLRNLEFDSVLDDSIVVMESPGLQKKISVYKNPQFHISILNIVQLYFSTEIT